MPARLILIMLLATTATAEQFARIGTYGGRFARIPVDARGEATGLATTVNPLGAHGLLVESRAVAGARSGDDIVHDLGLSAR